MRLPDEITSLSRRLGLPAPARRRRPALLAGEIAAGAVALAAGGLLAYWLKERAQEEAAHTVLESDGPFSLRRYAPLVLASTRAGGSITAALDQGFGRLYAYIAGRERARRPGESTRGIAMTVPVTAAADNHPGQWAVRFIMPRGWFRDTLPEPADGVIIEEQPGRLIAAVRFPGRASDRELMARKREALLNWVAVRGLRPSGEPEFAGYNAPIVPGPVRRNEWWVPIAE